MVLGGLAVSYERGTPVQVLADKLRYAIQHCKAIDADFAARGAAGEGGLDNDGAGLVPEKLKIDTWKPEIRHPAKLKSEIREHTWPRWRKSFNRGDYL